jgi:ABC-2 type transport system permease protein
LTKASGEESVKGLNEIKIGIGGAFGYLIMMFIIIYGNMVMQCYRGKNQSNSRNHNFLSETISIDDGKIIGTSLAGLLQFLIWAIMECLFAASAFLE